MVRFVSIIMVLELNEDQIKSMKDTYNDFEKAVWDGLQLAFKMTVNSLLVKIRLQQAYIFKIYCSIYYSRKKSSSYSKG